MIEVQTSLRSLILRWVWNNPLIIGTIREILTAILVVLIIFMITRKVKNKTFSKKIIISSIVLFIIIVLIFWMQILLPTGWDSLIE